MKNSVISSIFSSPILIYLIHTNIPSFFFALTRMSNKEKVQLFQEPFLVFRRDAYNNSFQVSGTPGKHQ